MNNKVILFLNGEEPTDVPNLSEYQKIYCTDGSYNYLKTLGIVPDVIAGDFDSISTTSFPKNVEVIHTPDQNFTDFEKVLQIIVDQNFTSVDVFGASGKQQDHFLGNLNAAYKFKDRLLIQFIDNYSTYNFIPKHFTLENVAEKIISLVPFPETKGITTTGLLYPLNNEDLNLLERIGTRNKAITNKVKITYSSGELVLFVMK
ncbi:thiamine diphosphokinase [Faecalibacter sp. LW9]|uniref:thiamine diphosphokinase n=1 Tax=Faecalibacter sp. LW9 TaxID=3103144 RepID=UPI002AFE24DB|nr:thiamine diphosphokinase [Faecalibacter sp. LW9]